MSTGIWHNALAGPKAVQSKLRHYKQVRLVIKYVAYSGNIAVQ